MRIAFIADIHSNLEALKAVLNHIKAQKIANILCCGDIVGYGASPNECCEIIKLMKIPCVQGNHDLDAVDLQKPDWYNQYGLAALRWTSKQLTAENKEFLHALPKMSSIKAGGKTILLVHGSIDNPLYGYVFPTASEDQLKDIALRSKSDILAMGHTHMPMVKKVAERIVLNPGSVGQPRDNIPNASYIILDTDLMRANIMRVKYDIDSAARKIVAASLPRYLGDRLYQGQ